MTDLIDRHEESPRELPALSLIFHVAGEREADLDDLLGMSDAAYEAIQSTNPRFSILKSFTHYAGAPYMSLSEERDALRAQLSALRARVEGAKELVPDIEWWLGLPDRQVDIVGARNVLRRIIAALRALAESDAVFEVGGAGFNLAPEPQEGESE